VNYYFLFFFLTLILLNLIIYIFRVQIFDFLKLVDKATSRKIHKGSIPIVGSVISLICFCYIVYILNNSNFFLLKDKIIFLFSLFLIILIGFLDDKFSLDPLKRITLFIIVISLNIIQNDNKFLIEKVFVDYNYQVELYKISILFTLFCLISLIVATDLFDGINLIVSYFFLTKFVFINYFFKLPHEFVLINYVIIISLLIFIIFNIKNLVFLGSAGTAFYSIILGYEIIYINNFLIKSVNVIDILVLLFLPGIDMLRIFFLRIFKSGKIFVPDKKHFHHLLFFHFGKIKSIIFICLFVTAFDLLILTNLFNNWLIFLTQLFIYIFFIVYIKSQKN